MNVWCFGMGDERRSKGGGRKKRKVKRQILLYFCPLYSRGFPNECSQQTNIIDGSYLIDSGKMVGVSIICCYWKSISIYRSNSSNKISTTIYANTGHWRSKAKRNFPFPNTARIISVVTL
jgi:hypothetical protein